MCIYLDNRYILLHLLVSMYVCTMCVGLDITKCRGILAYFDENLCSCIIHCLYI